MIFWVHPKGTPVNAYLFMQSEALFQLIFSILARTPKARAERLTHAGLKLACYLALFLWPRLRVILQMTPCLMAGLFQLQTDGAAK